MKWVVGLDFRASSQGAIRTAAWLGRHTEPRQRNIGVHVIEEPMRVAVRDDVLDELVGRAQTLAAETLAQEQAADAFERVDAVTGKTAEDKLTELCNEAGADGIIIGRQAFRDRPAFIRLGRVARRLVRTLPVPVIVVPPDLDPKSIGAGPVVVGTDLSSDSAGACRFALALAQEIERDLVVAHVQPVRDLLLGRDTELVDEDEVDPKLELWMREHGLGGARGVLLRGDIADQLLLLAEREHACILATGSRHLGLAERVFQSSVGTDLARMADRPVLVVPPAALTAHPG